MQDHSKVNHACLHVGLCQASFCAAQLPVVPCKHFSSLSTSHASFHAAMLLHSINVNTWASSDWGFSCPSMCTHQHAWKLIVTPDPPLQHGQCFAAWTVSCVFYSMIPCVLYHATPSDVPCRTSVDLPSTQLLHDHHSYWLQYLDISLLYDILQRSSHLTRSVCALFECQRQMLTVCLSWSASTGLSSHAWEAGEGNPGSMPPNHPGSHGGGHASIQKSVGSDCAAGSGNFLGGDWRRVWNWMGRKSHSRHWPDGGE